MTGADATGRDDLLERTLPDLEEITASVFARDRRSGAVLVDHRSAVPVLPASNMKLITAACGFEELGPDYRFETTAYAVGEVRDGHLLGDIVLTGRGAPDLSQADLMSLAEDIHGAGIDTVAGAVVVDASAFDRQVLGPGWTWDDSQFEYGAKSTPLALERNTVDITVSHRNGTVHADASPTSQTVRLDVDVAVSPDADGELSVFKKRASEVIRVEGRIPPDSSTTEASPVDDPMMHAGSVFRNALESKGVSVDGWTRIEYDPVETAGATAFVLRSAPLGEIVRDALVHSLNFAADQLARTIAFERTGTGTWEGWQDHATSFLDRRGGDAMRLCDGSGLSRYNLVSAGSIASVLEFALEQPWGDLYRRALPLGGEEGTVSDRLADVPVPVRAKTGTLTGTRTLSGYIEAGDGTPAIVFACLLSNLAPKHERVATDRLDEFVRELVREADLGD